MEAVYACPDHVSVEISCAERTGFLREGLRAASVRSYHPDNSRLLNVWCWQTDLCSSHLSFAETLTFASTAFRPSLPAAFWLTN